MSTKVELKRLCAHAFELGAIWYYYHCKEVISRRRSRNWYKIQCERKFRKKPPLEDAGLADCFLFKGKKPFKWIISTN